MPEPKNLLTQTAPELRLTVDQALQKIAELRASLGGLVSLTKDDRRAVNGRFRDGEAAALEGPLDVAELNPGAFSVLAGADGGSDATVFETAMLRDKLRATGMMVEFADALEVLARDVRDTQLQLGADVRGPVLAAYEIAKGQARYDAKSKSALAKTLDFYARDKKAAAPKE